MNFLIMLNFNFFKTSIFLSVVFMSLFLLSCEKQEVEIQEDATLAKTATNPIFDEAYLVPIDMYEQLSTEEQRVANYINAAVSSLAYISYGKKRQSYMAMIDLSSNELNAFSNFITIGVDDGSDILSGLGSRNCSGSCTITSAWDAPKCVKSIAQAVDDCGGITINVSSNGSGGYDVSWAPQE